MQLTPSLRRAASAATVLALTAPISVFAQGSAFQALNNGVTNAGTEAGLGTSKSLPQLIGRLVQQAMTLLGILLVVMVIYAGFLYMTDQGAGDKAKKAKGIITSAVIGLVLIFAAYSITGFVVTALGEVAK
jgi:cytochrome bd-type quinol oxidase subunit 2